jgi:hypothetical protein
LATLVCGEAQMAQRCGEWRAFRLAGLAARLGRDNQSGR